MQSNDVHPLDPTLAAVALTEAYIRRDKQGVDAVLADQADHTAILSALLMMFEDVLTKASDGHPHEVLDGLRARLIAKMAEPDGED